MPNKKPNKTNNKKKGVTPPNFSEKAKLIYIEMQKKATEKAKRKEEQRRKLLKARLDKKMAINNLNKEIEKARLEEKRIIAQTKKDSSKVKSEIILRKQKQKDIERLELQKIQKQKQVAISRYKKMEQATLLEKKELEIKKRENKKHEIETKRNLKFKNIEIKRQLSEKKAALQLKFFEEQKKLKQELAEFKQIKEEEKQKAKQDLFEEKQKLKIQKQTHKAQIQSRLQSERKERMAKIIAAKKEMIKLKAEKLKVKSQRINEEEAMIQRVEAIKENDRKEISKEQRKLELEIKLANEKQEKETKEARLQQVKELSEEERRIFTPAEVEQHERLMEETEIAQQKEDFNKKVQGAFSNFKEIQKRGERNLNAIQKTVTNYEKDKFMKVPEIKMSIEDFEEAISKAQPVELRKLFFHAALLSDSKIKEDVANTKFDTLLKALLIGYAVPLFNGTISVNHYGKVRKVMFNKTTPTNKKVVNVNELISKKYIKSLEEIIIHKLKQDTTIEITKGLLITRDKKTYKILSDANLFRI